MDVQAASLSIASDASTLLTMADSSETARARRQSRRSQSRSLPTSVVWTGMATPAFLSGQDVRCPAEARLSHRSGAHPHIGTIARPQRHLRTLLRGCSWRLISRSSLSTCVHPTNVDSRRPMGLDTKMLGRCCCDSDSIAGARG